MRVQRKIKHYSFVIGATLWLILMFYLVIAIPIGLHEAGHLIAFKQRGVAVKTFAIGIGSPFTLFKGEQTEYKLGIIPLAGYNMPYTEADPEADALRSQGFRMNEDLSPAEALWVSLAGLITNALTVVILFAYLIVRDRRKYGNCSGSIQSHLARTRSLAKVLAINLLTLGRFPSKGSPEDVLSRSFLKPGWIPRPENFLIISLGLLILNLFPVGFLDGSRMLHACCMLAGMHIGIGYWVGITSPVMLLLIFGRLFVRQAAPRARG